jgi:nitrate reductase (NAD(P)H)
MKGWMERVKEAGGDLANGYWGEKAPGEIQEVVVKEPEKQIAMTNPQINRQITIQELKAHSDEQEPWFVINGEVYDGTPYLSGHPGGAASIFGAAGQDATEEFMAIRKFITSDTGKWFHYSLTSTSR